MQQVMRSYFEKVKYYWDKLSFNGNGKLHLIILIMLPLFLYVRVIGFGILGFDDNGIIDDAAKWLTAVKAGDDVLGHLAKLGNFGDSFYRPVQFLTYEIDASFSQNRPWMFHISNLLVHLLTVITLYFFLQHFNFKRITAFIFAALFAVHPLSAVAVAWVPSRGDTLIALFGMVLFITYDNYFKKQKTIHLILHMAMFLVTILTKESTVFFPVFLFTYSHYILKVPFSLKKYLPFFISWTTFIGVYFILRKLLFHSGMPSDAFTITNFIKNLPALPSLFGEIVFPYKLSTLPLYDFRTLLIGLITIVPAAVISIKKAIEKNYLYIWAFSWFVAFNLAPMFYRLSTADYFYNYLSHRNYLPMLGIFLFVALYFAESKLAVKKMFVVICAAGLICLFTGMSFIQSDYYKTGSAFNKRAWECNQKNVMALNGIGSDAFGAGRFDEAFGIFNQSLGIWKNALAYYYRGCIYEIKGQNDKAMADYSTLMQYLNTLPSQGILIEALNNRASQKVKRKDYEGAIVDLNIAAQIDTTSYIIMYNLGNYHLEVKRYTDAVACFTRAISLKSGLFEAYTNRGICRYELHDYAGALSDYQEATKINPFYQLAYNNTGVTLRELQRYDEAIEYFNRTLSMNSKFAAAYYGRATVYLRIHDLEAAKADFIEALKLGYEPAKQFLREIPAKKI